MELIRVAGAMGKNSQRKTQAGKERKAQSLVALRMRGGRWGGPAGHLGELCGQSSS